MSIATLTEFRVVFPEFSAVGDEMVQAFLDMATLEIDADVWGVKAKTGNMYLAAHKMALSPFGQAARLSKGSESTTYLVHYKTLVAQVACGRGHVT